MSEDNFDWIPLSKWPKHYPYPSLGAMRNICARREKNGAHECMILLSGRPYVSVSKFGEWMNRQTLPKELEKAALQKGGKSHRPQSNSQKS